jgi:hypothetical protein
MKFKDYINESAAPGGNIDKYLRNLKTKNPKEAEKILKNDWKALSNILKKHALEKDAIAIINKHFGTNYRDLNQIDKADVSKLPTKYVYEEVINEDFKNFWELIKSEGFPVLAFYPALTVWMEIDKLLSGTGEFMPTKAGIYALFWAILVSGKFLKGWEKWRRENPEEFKKEGSRKNPFAIRKKE